MASEPEDWMRTPERRVVDWPSRGQIVRQLGVVALVAGVWAASLVGVIRITDSGGAPASASARAERSGRPGDPSRQARTRDAREVADSHETAVAAAREVTAPNPRASNSPSAEAAGPVAHATESVEAPSGERAGAPGDPVEPVRRADPSVAEPVLSDEEVLAERARTRPTSSSRDDDPFQVDEAEVGDLGGAPPAGAASPEQGTVAALPESGGAPSSSRRPGEDAMSGTDTGSATVSFSRDVLPILDRRCVKCHGGERPQGGQRIEEGLSLLSWEDVLAGSTWGVVVVPGDPVGSFLLEQVEKGEMPEKEPRLLPREIRAIRQWIEAGAPKN